MVLLVLFLLGVIGVWFLKAIGFMMGATCTIMGVVGVVSCIYILVTGVEVEFFPVYIMVTLFSLAMGIFFLCLVFRKKNDEKKKERKTKYELHLSPAFEDWMKNHNTTT